MRKAILLACLSLGCLAETPAPAQSPIVREAVERFVRELSELFVKRGAREIGGELAEYGGEAFVRRVAERVVREGGEEAIEKVARLARQYGPDVLKALDNAPSTRAALKALDELPADQIGPALKRLTAGRQGQALGGLLERHGAGALRAEIAHPGVGVRLVDDLGDAGIRLSLSLGREEAIAVARHSADIARLPDDLKQGVLRLLYEDTKRMVGFMGRFVERNPQSTLFTAGTVTILLANSERILGGDEVVLDSAGNPKVVSKPGLVGRVIEKITPQILTPVLLIVAAGAAVGLGLWLVPRWVRRGLMSLVPRLKPRRAEPPAAGQNAPGNSAS